MEARGTRLRHPFDRYFRKHGHFPEVVVRSGAQRLVVSFHPGYVLIVASPPMSARVYITRTAWLKMLKASVGITKYWAKNPADDWDVPLRMHESFLDEMAILEEKRRMKKSRRIDPGEMDRQRRRFLAAKARGKVRRERTAADASD